MRKLVLMALSAVLSLALVAGVASARTGLRSAPATSTLFIHNLEFSGGFNTVRCDITQSVSLHSSVAKREGELAGFATIAVSTGACGAGNAGLFEPRGARITGLSGPYHVQYVSFRGELPRIESVTLKVVGVHFWITEPGGITCESNEAISGTTTGGNPASGMNVEREGVRLEGFCGFASGKIRGAGSLFRELAHAVAQSTTITLV